MNDQQKKYLGWLAVAIAVIVATFLGVTYPMPAPPQAVAPQAIATVTTGSHFGTINADTGYISALSSDSATLTAATVTTATVTSLSLNSVTLSGMKCTTGSSVSNGSLIAHTLTTTPTYAIATTSAVTGAGISAMNATSVTISAAAGTFSVYLCVAK